MRGPIDVAHRALQVDRRSEVAAEDPGQERSELRRERAVEAELVADASHRVRRRMGAQRDPHRVARDEVDQQESGERDDEQDEHRVQRPPRADRPSCPGPASGPPGPGRRPGRPRLSPAQLFQTSQRFHQPLSSVWKFCTFAPSPVRAGTKKSGTHGASASVSCWIWPKTFLRFASFVVELAASVSVQAFWLL